MRASAYSQADLRRREPSFAARKRGGAAPVALARTPDASRERSFLGTVGVLAFATALTAALLIGWRDSDEGHLTPESGVGYWLGIAGASAMLLLLLYPLRKRMKALRGFGRLSAWFRIHMLLGVIGPALILFHCNFKLGSLNSNVALFSMLTVAASGLVGRYLYSRVHLGLYGRRLNIEDLLSEVSHLKGTIQTEHSPLAVILNNLEARMQNTLAEHTGVISSLLALLLHRIRSPSQRAQLMDEVKRRVRAEGRKHGWSWWKRRRRLRMLRKLLRQYLAAADKVATFAFYEHLFALWHVLHVPLFILLILAAVVHVVGVHLY
jgi:hypothetical protein